MYDSLTITPKTRGYQIISNHTNFHLYHYAGNNPIRYIDPNGKNAVPKIYQHCPVIEKVQYYNQIVSELEQKQKYLTVKLDSLKQERKNLLNTILSKHGDSFMFCTKTILSILQITGGSLPSSTSWRVLVDYFNNLSISDLADFVADFDMNDLKSINFSQLVKNDINFLIDFKKINEKIYDIQWELKRTNEKLKENRLYLVMAYEELLRTKSGKVDNE